MCRCLLCLQSDVVHQSVFELIHTDDRASFRQQLHFALNPPAETDADGTSRRGQTAPLLLGSPGVDRLSRCCQGGRAVGAQ